MRYSTLFKKVICIITVLLLIGIFSGVSVFATEEGNTTITTTTTPTTTTTTTTKKTTTPSSTTTTSHSTTATTTASATNNTTTPTSTSSNKTTATGKKKLAFKEDNKKEVEVSRSVVLYITSTGINNLNTEFTCSDTSIATVLKINDSSVRVFGLKNGEVTVTAISNDIKAKIRIKVGTGTAANTTTTPPDEDAPPTPETPPNNILFVSSEENTASAPENDGKKEISDEELFGNLQTESKLKPATVVTAVIWWGIILLGAVVVTVIVLNNNTGKMRLKRSSVSTYSIKLGGAGRRRMYSGLSSGHTARRRRGRKKANERKRLLPDRYYRHLRKW